MTPGGGPGNDNANSLLPIVTSQRDRFRQRNSELEEVGHSATPSDLTSS